MRANIVEKRERGHARFGRRSGRAGGFHGISMPHVDGDDRIVGPQKQPAAPGPATGVRPVFIY
jgi:hypothetical protein